MILIPYIKREPWYTANIDKARRVTRRYESQYRKHRNVHDRNAYNHSFTKWRNKLQTAKIHHLSGLIAKNPHRFDLYRSMNTVRLILYGSIILLRTLLISCALSLRPKLIEFAIILLITPLGFLILTNRQHSQHHTVRST